MDIGTIVLTLFPFTDLTSAKRRPAVVVSKTVKHKSDAIVAFISSVVPDELSETDLLFNSDRKDFKKSGLKKTSVFKLDKLATLNKSIFTGELGSIDLATLNDIDTRLIIALGLNKNNK